MKNLWYKTNPVVCLDYNKVYESVSLASKLTGCARTSIAKCCTGERISCYNLQGRRLKWMYAKDYANKYGLDALLELHSTSSDFY